MEWHLKAIGVILTLLAIMHASFPKRFNWKKELISLSLLNREMMYIHTLFIAVVLLLMGVLCFASPQELLTTKLGHQICFGLAIFWTLRLFVQFFGYSARLWKGKSFETRVHVVFTLLWSYVSGVFWFIAL
jgi:hypothetical protein